MPSVSVVVPTWNSGAYLGEALDSILGQTFSDFELIIVDSGSEDDTRDILAAREDSRMSLINLPFKCGIAIPRNIGILAAEGEFIAIMDSDDCMHPARLEKQAGFLRQNPHVDVLGSSFMFMHEGRRSARNQPSSDARIKAQLLYVNGNALHDPTVMLRKAFLEKHRLSYPNLPVDLDHALWVSCVRAGATFANLKDHLLDYRYHEASASRADGGVQQRQKTPIREDLLGLLLPDLTRVECHEIALLMERGGQWEPVELFAGVHAIDKALRFSRCAHGADIRTLKRILSAYRKAALADGSA